MQTLVTDFSVVKIRIEGRRQGVYVPTLFGYALRPCLTAVIITDQGLWLFQQESLVKEAKKYLKKVDKYCQWTYGWRKIHTEYVFRTSQADTQQPRAELCWEVKL